MFDVPLSERSLGAEEIEMPEECMRPGEILLGPGVCGPDPRLKPVTSIVRPGARIAVAPKIAASASSVVAGMSTTTMLFAAVGAVGLIYYLGKHR
jgi:hypothetical protein